MLFQKKAVRMSDQVVVRLTPEFRLNLEREAERSGVELSAFIRILLQDAMKQRRENYLIKRRGGAHFTASSPDRDIPSSQTGVRRTKPDPDAL